MTGVQRVPVAGGERSSTSAEALRITMVRRGGRGFVKIETPGGYVVVDPETVDTYVVPSLARAVVNARRVTTR